MALNRNSHSFSFDSQNGENIFLVTSFFTLRVAGLHPTDQNYRPRPRTPTSAAAAHKSAPCPGLTIFKMLCFSIFLFLPRADAGSLRFDAPGTFDHVLTRVDNHRLRHFSQLNQVVRSQLSFPWQITFLFFFKFQVFIHYSIAPEELN
jgi:hypothetical protein